MKSLLATLVTTFIIFSLFSCSNAAEVKVVTEDPETLKSVVADKEFNVTWTNELEGERLTENIYSDSEYISDYFYLSPDNVIVSHKNEEPIYPELKGFGSLDTRNIPSSIKYIITSFCDALSKDVLKGAEQYFDSNYYFNYVFFKTDLLNTWEDRFFEPYPLAEEEKEEETKSTENDEVSEEEKETSEKKEEKVKPSLFNKWILGKPFITDNVLQQPVRFYRNNYHLDLLLYVNMDNNKIFQIVEGPYANTK